MNDGYPGLGVRPDIVDFTDLPDFLFHLERDQVLDLMDVHARKRGNDDCLANLDRGIFLPGIVEKDQKTDQWNSDQDHDRDPVHLDRELGNFSEHIAPSVRPRPSNLTARRRLHEFDGLAIDQEVHPGSGDDIPSFHARHGNHVSGQGFRRLD